MVEGYASGQSHADFMGSVYKRKSEVFVWGTYIRPM